MLKSLLPIELTNEDSSFQTVEELHEVLHKAIDEGNIKNIALTGPFGSGKSSILQTLRKIHKDFEYLPISLATLQAHENEGCEDNNCDDDGQIETLNRKIEYSILQQLIYREKTSTVPNSRFRRIVHIDKRDLCGFAFFGVLFLISFLVAFEPSWVRVESIYNALNFGGINIYFDAIAVLYMLVAAFFLLKYVVKSYSNSKLNKLNLKDGEIEIQEENSIFNKHLDEILYFFQVTEYNVLIIEDLDRFGTSNIFLKLRELNRLINESKIVGRNVVFLYAIKDDVFINEERTKFFDYITTVIPVINPSNSKDKLKDALNERGIEDGLIKDGDLADMAFFIQDMRILTNIANEFFQYKEKLCTANGQKLNITKLLAMIVYKNYHPKDFAQLHRRAGKVYNCINAKPQFIQHAIDEISIRQKQLEEEYKLYLDNKHLKVKELRLLYLGRVRDSLNERLINIQVNNQYYSLDAIANDSNLFSELVSQSTISYEYFYGYSGTTTSSGNVDHAKIDKVMNFNKRLASLGMLEETFRHRKTQLQKEHFKVQSFTLRTLIGKYKQGNSELYKSLNLSEMIDVFIRRGFLDEEYYDYISYFYPGMVSFGDRDLLLSIRREIPKEYTYRIDKVQNFVKELLPYMFETNSILNNDLLNCLAKFARSDREYNDLFIRIMYRLEIDDAPLDFLSQYYTLGKEQSKVFKHYIEWDRIKSWENIGSWKNATERDILREGWLKFSDDLKGKPEMWLNSNYNFVIARIDNIGMDRCMQLVENACFEHLNSESPELLTCAVENSSYVINTHNLCLIANFLQADSVINEDNLNLSRITNAGNTTFIDYVKSNISIAFSYFSANCKDENSEAILYFLNSSELSSEEKTEYLKGQQNLLKNCDNISSDELITLAYQLYLIRPTWVNVILYYRNKKKIQEVYIKYIEKYALELSKNKISGDEEDCRALFSELMGTNALNYEAYKFIIDSFDWQFNGSSYLEELEAKRLTLLLSHSHLPFNDENTAVLKKTPIYIDYLLYHYSAFYAKRGATYFINAKVAERVLSFTMFTKNEKKELISIIPESLLASSQPLADIVIDVLLNFELTVLSESMMKILFQNANNIVNRVRLATSMIKTYNYGDTSINELLQVLGGKYQEIAERAKHPVLINTEWNLFLVGALKSREFISSYKEENDGIRIHPKRTK